MSKKSKIYKFIVGLLLMGILILGGILFVENSSGIHEIDNQGLEKTIYSNKERLIYIGRPSCPYCQMVQPKLEKVAKKNHFQLRYYNTDDARKSNEKKLNHLLNKMQVQSVPTVVLVKDNHVIKKWDAVNDLQKINKYISDNQLNII